LEGEDKVRNSREGGRVGDRWKGEGVGREGEEEEGDRGVREMRKRVKEREERGEESRRGGRRKVSEVVGRWRAGFWNVAGVRNKGVKFWEEIKKWEVIVMVETWVDERGWDAVKSSLPKGYRWEKQLAKRRNKKGRPMGGIIIGVKEESGVAVISVVEGNEGG